MNEEERSRGGLVFWSLSAQDRKAVKSYVLSQGDAGGLAFMAMADRMPQVHEQGWLEGGLTHEEVLDAFRKKRTELGLNPTVALPREEDLRAHLESKDRDIRRRYGKAEYDALQAGLTHEHIVGALRAKYTERGLDQPVIPKFPPREYVWVDDDEDDQS